MFSQLKRTSVLFLCVVLLFLFLPAAAQQADEPVKITLSDEGVTVGGAPASSDPSQAVYTANDIVFYLEGQDFTYGEGTQKDEHSQAEANAHTVVHITKPGVYSLSGSLCAGQVAVDLGSDAKKDKNAVVTLILDGVDITSTVAPAIIFYNVYECGDDDPDTASMNVDTSAAGANIVIADGSANRLCGSYVARIYESVELSEDGTEVVDSKKLHKYDGTLYSKRSMNISGGEKGDGTLTIIAENEGLCSDLHLTINGGVIDITSGNDGINASEDYVSVCTINGGTVNITVDGATGEGDGIDSNGWLIINGGEVNASACAFSGDAGIDSDMGIHINGGSVLAGGNMLDHISGNAQPYAVFQFASRIKGGEAVTLKNESGEIVGEYTPVNDYSYLILSGESLVPGTYTLWQGDTQLAGSKGEMRGMPPTGGAGMTPPDGMERRKDFDPFSIAPPEGTEFPEGFDPSSMTPPEGMERPEMPDGFDPAQRDGFDKRGFGGGRGFGSGTAEVSAEFVIDENGSTFVGVGALQK